ncbi:hypothetical protein A2415_01535 [candidate division WWE3 bacterium RIFOXYC1_FULL_39_7]|uniref:Nudix hydrolase domain-containing protein n=2 Tax=Katanobacteria TaxID=422282 RepID=A0A1F4X6P9_UNCKA|nr:MAG: hypothetical protein A2415_01535 [candidate division WWE3 bacterium RIFOXYC1_FULL_39_7]OGC76783.1 MAG: hypothetical protein A2619_00460 [candidate division WWE3 bacterium RIFOXYD1_FULL_39_9]
MFENFRLIQKALIEKDGKFLAIKRSDYTSYCPHTWELPGGQVEFGEDLAKALEREVEEETSLKISTNGPLITNSSMAKGIYIVGIIYKCDYLSGDVNLSDEHTDYKWVSKKELLDLDLSDWMAESLHNFFTPES